MEEETGESPKRPGGVPFKLVGADREVKKGVVATSLQDLITRARTKLAVEPSSRLKVVLEQDGTEVDDDEYFSTMENNTTLMVLINDEKWVPNGKLPGYRIFPMGDELDGAFPRRELEGLVDHLHENIAHISMLGGKELELLMDMDPDSLADIIPDRARQMTANHMRWFRCCSVEDLKNCEVHRIFLEHVKEASGRFLCEKRQAQDAIELLKMYPKHQDEVLSKKEKA